MYMKQILTSVVLSLLTTLSIAQNNKPYEMMVNGLKVIVVPSGNDIVQVNLVIKGGVQNYTIDKAGIESLAIQALTECGTAKDTKNSFKDKLDAVDAKIGGYTSMDAAHFTLNCIKADFEAAWPLYVDALTTPAFNAIDFARIKEKAINNVREIESNPDADIFRMANQTAFKGKDYAKSPSGTVASLQKLTPAETKTYLKSILTKSRVFMVVVSDISKEDLEKKIAPLASAIPQGQPFVLKRDSYKPVVNSFVPQKKDVATNYVVGISSAPASNSPEYFPAQLASGMMYDKIFLEVRTNHGLSYAPGAWISSGLTPYSVMSVSTKEPDKFIAVARNMVDSIKKNGFPADDVNNTKNTYATYQYYNNETNASLAYMVAGSEVEQGDWHRAFTLKEDLKSVTPADVNAVFNKYIGNFTWVYQGDPTKVTPTLYTQKQTPPPLKPEQAPVIMGKVPAKQ
jgi:zinc protease